MLCIPKGDDHFRNLNGPFESANLEKALEICTKFGTAIDGGAHVGSWSIRMAEVFNDVLAFEPVKDNYDCLVKNTKGIDRIKTYNKAIGDIGKRMAIHDAENSGAGYIEEGNDFDMITIDSLNLGCLDFLKLDVEGYEPKAIIGAMDTLEKFKPVVLVEQKKLTARYGLSYVLAGNFLESMGYKFVVKIRNDYIYKC
jgi:FkbM family methyltransferase